MELCTGGVGLVRKCIGSNDSEYRGYKIRCNEPTIGGSSYCEQHQEQGRWGNKTNLFTGKLLILLGVLLLSVAFPILEAKNWEEGYFQCPSGRVIDGSKVLDGSKDCSHGHDEKRAALFEIDSDAEEFRENHPSKSSLELCALFCWLPLLNIIGFFIIKSYSPVEFYLEKEDIDSIISKVEGELSSEPKVDIDYIFTSSSEISTSGTVKKQDSPWKSGKRCSFYAYNHCNILKRKCILCMKCRRRWICLGCADNYRKSALEARAPGAGFFKRMRDNYVYHGKDRYKCFVCAGGTNVDA